MPNLYLSGCSGQGKTTTANLLSKELSMPVVDGLSRNSPYKMGTDDHQIYLSKKVFSSCQNTNDTIHCRTPFDVLAYSHVYGRGNESLDEDNCSRFASSNPVVFYFPYWLLPQEDGFRPTNETLNRRVDEKLWTTLNLYKDEIKIYIVHPGTLQQRVDLILSAIDL